MLISVTNSKFCRIVKKCHAGLTFLTSRARSLNDELRAVSKPGLLAPDTVTMV